MADTAVISHKPPIRTLVEAAARLHVHDLRGPFGWFGSHEIRASDGVTIKLRLDVGEHHGFVAVEHWPTGARWAASTYELALFARPQPSGGVAWLFSCPMSGVRTPVLYLPAGASCLGSRAAHGLGYRSQRQRAPARAAVRAHRLATDLGITQPGAPPARPRGRWVRTFDRRAAALARLVDAAALI